MSPDTANFQEIELAEQQSMEMPAPEQPSAPPPQAQPELHSPEQQAIEAPGPEPVSSPEPQGQVADITGFIDTINGTRVLGWAWDRNNPQSKLSVEVCLDNEPVATVVAEEMRDHLAKAGVGDGAHGFTAQLPKKLAKEEHHRISATVHLEGYGGVTQLKNKAAASPPDALALRPSDFSGMMGQLEQCVSDQRAGFRWIYHELHELDQFVRNQAQNAPAIDAQAIAPIEDDDIADAICAMETQMTEMVQNQTVIQDSLEEIGQLQKTLNQRLEQQDGFTARIESSLLELQKDRDDEPDYSDGQQGLKRLILFLGCLTVASLATGIAALFF